MARSRTSSRPTYRELVVRTECYRVLVLIGAAVVAVLIAATRSMLAPGQGSATLAQLSIAVVPIGYGAWYIAMVRRLGRAGRELPAWLWMSNVAFECAWPSVLIFLLWRAGVYRPTQALVSPPVIGYGVVLIMSTLRRSPIVSLVTGLGCAAGHLVLVLAVLATRSPADETEPPAVLLSYPAWILMGGIAASFVASEIRRHVNAMLEEAGGRDRAEKEIALAADVQQGLLPKSEPVIEGFEVTMWNRPAAETGGDYYDWQLLADGRLAVSLADVTGHGLGPALVAAFCRAYARATLRGRPALHEAIAQVNSLIATDLPPGRFVTLAVALVQPGSDLVELVSAGHGPVLVYRAASASIELLLADGPPLGIGADWVGDRLPGGTSITLQPRDALILITDGFFEWPRPDGERFGIDRLGEAIARADREGADVIASIRAAVEEFAAGSPQEDDLTAVVIRRAATAPDRPA
ncbi:MAG: PP2C family protein-serine/threonine phosphatase [Phycisphaerae bacterium]|nr:PP2C family protein-serine/threonine phosphatase [Phycisphaerae bacterium]